MGVTYRKSKRIGSFGRVNFSRRGVGFSVGVPGMRIGRKAGGGTYLRGGKDGIVVRKDLTHPHHVRAQTPTHTRDVAGSREATDQVVHHDEHVGAAGWLVLLVMIIVVPVLVMWAAISAWSTTGAAIGAIVVVAYLALLVAGGRHVERHG